MSNSAYRHALVCTSRAAECAAAGARRELARGTASLYVVRCIAPLLGMFGTAALLTLFLRAQSLPEPCCGECACAGLSYVFFPLAMSLPIAIFAGWAFHHLRRQVERFDLEMRIATLNLLGQLEPRE
jgi:biopolymer transport protein ExbB/TolQ